MQPVKAAEATVEDRPAAVRAQQAPPLRLLVGYDGRPGSRDALALARALGGRDKAALTVGSIRPSRPELVGVENHLVGDPEAAGLKELAETEKADMIVLGSTHRGPIGQVCPGSVGERVLDGAPSAVALAPRGYAAGDASIREIAVGYDGSRASAVALRRAIGLAERCQASLLVLGVVEVSLGLAGYETRQSKEQQRAEMEHHLERALETVPSSLAARSRLLFGAPAPSLIEAASEADLLVLGSRGSYSVLRRVVLGTVGAAAIRSAACPTVITTTD